MSWIISWSFCTKRWQMSTMERWKRNLNFSSSSFCLFFIQITFSESPSCPYRTFRGKFRKYQNSPHSAATDESTSCVHNPRSPNNCTATVSNSHSMRSKSDKTVCDFDLYRCQRHLMSVASTFICSSLHERVTANFDVFFALFAQLSDAPRFELDVFAVISAEFLLLFELSRFARSLRSFER